MKNHLSLDRATTIQPPPDVTTKPRCADLPQKNTLPPKPQLGDVLAKSQAEGVPPEAQPPPDVTTRPRPVDLCPKGPPGDSMEKQASEDSNDLTPVPPPQKSIRVGGQRCCLDPCPLCCALTCWEAVCSLLTSPALGQRCSGLCLLVRAPGFGLQIQASGPACRARCSCVTLAGSSPSLSLSFLMYKTELTVTELLGDDVL